MQNSQANTKKIFTKCFFFLERRQSNKAKQCIWKKAGPGSKQSAEPAKVAEVLKQEGKQE